MSVHRWVKILVKKGVASFFAIRSASRGDIPTSNEIMDVRCVITSCTRRCDKSKTLLINLSSIGRIAVSAAPCSTSNSITSGLVEGDFEAALPRKPQNYLVQPGF